MSLILKTAASIYILSVLAFSSWSRASIGLDFQISIESFSEEGLVFEENGYLIFESNTGETTLIHSSSFEFFENLDFPAKVFLEGQCITKYSENVLQITEMKILRL